MNSPRSAVTAARATRRWAPGGSSPGPCPAAWACRPRRTAGEPPAPPAPWPRSA